MGDLRALGQIGELKTRAASSTSANSNSTFSTRAPKPACGKRWSGCAACPDLSVSDFGTRRRHSFLWHEYVVNAMRDTLGAGFTGTSNAYLAYKHDLEAIGTNGHELPMAMAALADSDEEAAQPRNTACSSSGSRATRASCSSCFPTPSAPRSFCATRPTGWPTGPASASTAKTPTWRATNTSQWLERARTRSAPEAPHRLRRSRRGADSRPARLLRRHSPQRRDARRLPDAPATFMTQGPLGSRAPHPLQRRLGHLSHQRLSQLQSAGRRRASTPSAWSASSPRSKAGPPSSSLTTTPRPWATASRNRALPPHLRGRWCLRRPGADMSLHPSPSLVFGDMHRLQWKHESHFSQTVAHLWQVARS